MQSKLFLRIPVFPVFICTYTDTNTPADTTITTAQLTHKPAHELPLKQQWLVQGQLHYSLQNITPHATYTPGAVRYDDI